jgi:hypothetical protein
VRRTDGKLRVVERAMPEDRVGTRLGAYMIERLIGRGGMGMVFLAEHVHLGRKVALKILPPDLAADESFRKRFVRESRLAAGVEHPNVIPVYDAGEADGELYIAMRYVEGTDLRAVLQRDGRLDDREALAILAQVAAALDAAHRDGLVHRDVKPGNILISPTQHVYLSDFGLTKRTAADTSVTATGFFVGTMNYAPPEQIQGHDLDGRADGYSLTCVAFECLTGRLPFVRDTDVALLYAHLQEPPPTATEHRAELPAAVDGVLARGMAKDRNDRYHTCSALVDDLRHALGGSPAAGAAPRPAAPAETRTTPAAVPGPTVPAAVPPQTVASPTEAIPAQAGSTQAPPTETGPPAAEPLSPPPGPPIGAPPDRGRRRGIWAVLGIAALLAAVGAFLVLGPLSSPEPTPNGETTAPGPDPTEEETGSGLETGLRIAFLRPGAGERLDVYTMNADGSGRRHIFSDIATGSTPSWSPDRRYIAVEGESDGDAEIYRLRMRPGGQLKPLTDNSAEDVTPSWSPDGESIAYASDAGGDLDIWVMDADGGNPRPVVEAAGDQLRPTWSPDGTQLAFEDRRSGNGDIWLVDLEAGTEPGPLLADPSDDTAPEWSPQDGRIAFRSNRDGNLEIYTMSAGGTDLQRLTETPAASERAPTWSPDGAQILFHSDAGGDMDIWIMNADGSGPRRLTNTPGDEFGATL